MVDLERLPGIGERRAHVPERDGFAGKPVDGIVGELIRVGAALDVFAREPLARGQQPQQEQGQHDVHRGRPAARRQPAPHQSSNPSLNRLPSTSPSQWNCMRQSTNAPSPPSA